MKAFESALNFIFIISTILFVVVAVSMFIVQCFSLVTLNGVLSAAVYKQAVTIGGIIAAIPPVTGLLLSYVKKEKKSEE